MASIGIGQRQGLGGSRSGRPRIGKATLIAVLFLAAVGIGAVASRGLLALPHLTMTAADVAARIDDVSEANPGVGAMFAALRAHYPAAYDELTARAAAALRRGDVKSAEMVAFDAARNLSRSKVGHLRHASPVRLNDWGKSALAVMNVAKIHSPKLCAQVAFGKIERPTGASPTSISNAVGRHAAAAIVAFSEGETAPQAYPAPTALDETALARAVAAQGLTLAEAQKVGDLAAIRALPYKEQCALGMKLLRGVVATPEPVRSRILSMMAAEAATLN